MQLTAGTELQGGKYRITGLLGQGGFGITYLATMQVEIKGPIGVIKTDIKVAVKEFFMRELCNREHDSRSVTIPSTGSREQVERYRNKFRKEAENLSSLDHPHIVKVLDVFDENGTSYYVMEYVDGGSLQQYVKEHGALTEQRAVEYIRQLASALDYMHGRHLCHLDLKPGNIMISTDRLRVRLIDFGLSKQYDDEGQQTSSTPVGISEGYAPTEQYEQNGIRNFSPATDIYSLGATFFYLLVGVRPPKASDVLNDGLPTLPAHITSVTRAAVEAAMQPRRKDRPQSISQFLSMLQASDSHVEDEETHFDDPETYLDDADPVVVEAGDKPKDPKPQPEGPKSQSEAPASQPKPSIWTRYKGALVGAAVVAGVVIGMMLFRNPQPAPTPDKPNSGIAEVLPPANTGSDSNRQEEQLRKAEEERKAKEDAERKRLAEEQRKQEEATARKAEEERKAKAEAERKRLAEEQRKQEEAAARKAEEERKAKAEAERKAKEEAAAAERRRKEEEARRQQAALNIEMVYVAGGTFKMGASSSDSEAYSDEKPAHSVTLSSYYIGKYEVTQKQWVEIMGSNPSNWKGDNLPVENVSWNDIQEFIRKLNARTGKSYRLPTEAEWEFAARGGNSSCGYKYSGSNNIDAVAWYDENSGSKTHAVGTKSPNELGIYDMTGNVLEWCQDWFDKNYYFYSPSSNPKGQSSGTRRVLRGGSWYYGAKGSRISYRIDGTPGLRSYYYGFRLALSE